MDFWFSVVANITERNLFGLDLVSSLETWAGIILFWAETLLILFFISYTSWTNVVYFCFFFMGMPQSILLLVVLLLSLYFFQYSVSLALVFNLSMPFVTGFCFRVPSGNFFVYPTKSPFSFLYFCNFCALCSVITHFYVWSAPFSLITRMILILFSSIFDTERSCICLI